MSHAERTAGFIRLLNDGTVNKRIISDEVLERIESSLTPFNPIDEGYTALQYAYRAAFSRLLDQGVDWTPVQQEAVSLRKKLALQDMDSEEARKATKWLPTTAPIIVDAVRAGGLVRLNYLCIECDTPKAGWALNLVDSSFPFLLLGLSGIILRPFDSPLFNSPIQIDRVFEVLEGKLGFQIAIGDLWLPDSIFKDKLDTGSVFRVDLSLFQRAFGLRETYFQIEESDKRSPWRMIFEQLGDFHNPEFSPEETAAFSEWSERQIVDAGEPSQKNRETAPGEDEEL